MTGGLPDLPALDPAREARIRASFAAQAMLATLGATVADVGPGRVVLEMPSDPRFGQQHGFTHAGAITTLVDTACGYAAFSLMAADREVLTVDFSANFLAPAVGQAFRATGTVLRAGRTLVITRGEVHALAEGREPRLIAAMQATMMAVTPPSAEPGA
ncbi:PaaI family thioesterase [Geodermatophilus sp. URMC 64]